jgi:NADPH:quinone reductase-like Zn-dependent oxidoreductase
VPGLDVAGTVVAVGVDVTGFAVGEEVFGIGQGSFAEYARARQDKLARLIEAGQLTPVVGKTYPLRQAPDAMRHLQAGHARGKLVLTMTDAG